MKVNDEFVVKIEKLINEGYGLARVDNQVVFVENSCPNDVLKIKINHISKSYAVASIVEIIEPSETRIEPRCALHNVCGSCNWQHINYDEQLRQKQQIVSETLCKFNDISCEINPTISSPKTFEYRCKVQYPVQGTKVSKRILSGYYKKNSHELINIKYCPMQPKFINDVNEFIKDKAQEFGISAYDEKSHVGILRHIIYRISSDESNVLIIFVINSDRVSKSIKNLAEIVSKNFENVVGVCVNFNEKKTNVIMGSDTVNVVGHSYYIETLGDIKYRVSANSFFQVNPLCAELIFNKVKDLISSRIKNPSILDAYSGVSSFGIWLSSIAKEVVSVEEVKSASLDAKENLILNNINNLKVINGDAAVEFKKMISSGVKFDVSITDPPRKGCTDESIENLINLTDKFIVYVSCNVATLSRDMQKLISKGFKPVYVQPVDMFPNTYHVETIVLFENIN